jgi:hypothetical protein
MNFGLSFSSVVEMMHNTYSDYHWAKSALPSSVNVIPNTSILVPNSSSSNQNNYFTIFDKKK